MKKLLRMLLCLIACMAGAAHADLTLEIVEMTRDPSTGAFTVVRSVNPASPGQFVLSATGVPTVLQLLNCAHPCTVYFPSGGTSPNLSVDTYKFSDTCSGAANPCTPASVARVVEAIIPGPHVAFKGLRITSLTGTADTWIGLIASTKAGDMGKLSKDGSYPAGVFWRVPSSTGRPARTPLSRWAARIPIFPPWAITISSIPVRNC